MKKDYSMTSLVGALIWAAAVILRKGLHLSGFVADFVNILPNFGVIWLIVGLAITFYPYVFKKDFPFAQFNLLVCIAVVLILISEVAHLLFTKAIFDIWDIVASVVAAGWLIVERVLALRKESSKDSAAVAK